MTFLLENDVFEKVWRKPPTLFPKNSNYSRFLGILKLLVSYFYFLLHSYLHKEQLPSFIGSSGRSLQVKPKSRTVIYFKHPCWSQTEVNIAGQTRKRMMLRLSKERSRKIQNHTSPITEIKFLDTNLIKDLNLLLHMYYSQNHSPYYWWILTKTIFFPGFKNPLKKITETRKLESFHEQHFVERKDEGRKPDKKTRDWRLKFMPGNLD